MNASIAALKNAASSDSSAVGSSHNANPSSSSSSSIGNTSMKSNTNNNNSSSNNSYNYYPNPSQPPIPPYSNSGSTSSGVANYSSYGLGGSNMNDTSSSMPPPVRLAPQVPNLNSTVASSAAGSWGEQDSYFSASRSMERRS